MPVSVTFWGLPVASSVMERFAAKAPGLVGVKVTLIWQLDPGDTGAATQVFVCANSTASCPVIETAETCKARLPVLVTLIACGLLVEKPNCWPKFKAESERLAIGPFMVCVSEPV